MTLTVWLAFVAACIVLALTPGPNMSLIVANTVSRGLRAGMMTLAGTTVGLAMLTAIAALGTGSVMQLMSDWFEVLRWTGAVYLGVLGLTQLRSAWQGGSRPLAEERSGDGRRWLHGLLVALSNPKVLLFLGAFFPQFVDPGRPVGSQLTLLAVTFMATLLVVDVCYTVAVAWLRQGFSARHFRLMDGIAGTLLLAGGAVLATVRRP